MRIREIRTIKVTDTRNFDRLVNDALAGGWTIYGLEAHKGEKLTTLVAFLILEEV